RPPRPPGPPPPPCPGLQLHVARFPERDPLPRRREFAVLRPRAGGQRRRRALHPHPQRELPLGAHLRHHRRASLRTAGLRRPLQRHLARRPAWLPHPEPDPRRATQPCSVPIGQPTLGRLNSAASCLNNRPHYTAAAGPPG